MGGPMDRPMDRLTTHQMSFIEGRRLIENGPRFISVKDTRGARHLSFPPDKPWPTGRTCSSHRQKA
jgi:hypothetical protein